MFYKRRRVGVTGDGVRNDVDGCGKNDTELSSLSFVTITVWCAPPNEGESHLLSMQLLRRNDKCVCLGGLMFFCDGN